MMPTRRISDLPVSCSHPDHHPRHLAPPGVHEHVCPACALITESMVWRKEPPNDDERRACHVWWLRSSKSSNVHIVMFARHGAALVDYSSTAYLDILEWGPGFGDDHFDPNDWPGEWAPCLPPERKEQD